MCVHGYKIWKKVFQMLVMAVPPWWTHGNLLPKYLYESLTLLKSLMPPFH